MSFQKLLPVTVPKHQVLKPKIHTGQLNKGGKISRMAADDMLRFKNYKYMTHKQASQIADLVNTYNSPKQPWQTNKVYEKANSYHFATDENMDVVGCVRIQKKKVSEGYISKLSVGETHRRKGHAFNLLSRAELAALSQGISKVKANIRIDNEASRKLFERAGYCEGVMFYDTVRDTIMSHWSKQI